MTTQIPPITDIDLTPGKYGNVMVFGPAEHVNRTVEESTWPVVSARADSLSSRPLDQEPRRHIEAILPALPEPHRDLLDRLLLRGEKPSQVAKAKNARMEVVRTLLVYATILAKRELAKRFPSDGDVPVNR